MSDSIKNMGGYSTLFISYNYPPVGGNSLPGVMRTVKFIRNIKKDYKHHVLTLKPEYYPSGTVKNNEVLSPVDEDKIVKVCAFDIFRVLQWLRTYCKEALKFQKHNQKGAIQAYIKNGGDRSIETPISLAQKGKDFLYDICYFPDQASPWILPAVYAGAKMVWRYKIKVIFATGMPWSSLVVGSLISFITRRPLIADFRDPWIGNPFHKSKGRFLDWCGAYLEKMVICQATVVSANTEPLRDDFLCRYPTLPENKIIVLPNGFDTEEFNRMTPGEGMVAPWNDTDLVLCHTGFLYGLRDPGPLLHAIRLVNEQLAAGEPRVKFVQIGNVELGYNLAETYDDLVKCGTLQIIPEVSYQHCIGLLKQADVLVNVQLGTKIQVPSKLYDYLALDRPILNLTPQDGALGKMVSRYGFGSLFDGEKVDEIVQWLIQKIQEKKTDTLRAFYPEKSKFEITKIAQSLDSVIKQIS